MTDRRDEAEERPVAPRGGASTGDGVEVAAVYDIEASDPTGMLLSLIHI